MKNSDSRPSRVEQAKQAAPPVSAIEALANNLYYQLIHGLSGTEPVAGAEGGIAQASRAVLKKAQEGDVRAFAECRAAIESARSPRPTPVSPTVYNDNRRQFFISDLRAQIVTVMRSVGPVTPAGLAQRLGTLQETVFSALDHEWFEKTADAWQLSEKAPATLGG